VVCRSTLILIPVKPLVETIMANQTDHRRGLSRCSERADLMGRSPAGRTRGCYAALGGDHEGRHDEIVDWLNQRVKGAPRIKAELEWQFTHALTLEAASFPHRTEGRILPLDEAWQGKPRLPSAARGRRRHQPVELPDVLVPPSIGPALALGMRVVIKPAEDTPVTGGLLIAKIYEEAGLPTRSFERCHRTYFRDRRCLHDACRSAPHLVHGFHAESAAISGALAIEAPRLKRVSLELGGNAPLVVLDDADLEHAVRSAVVGRFLHQARSA